MTLPIIAIAAFVGVAALVGGVAMLLRADVDSTAEDRLEMLTAAGGAGASSKDLEASVLSKPLGDTPNVWELIIQKFGRFHLLFEQANTNLTAGKFLLLCAILGVGSGIAASAAGLHPALWPIIGLATASLPFFWIMWRRKKRFAKFQAQLPDALELIARALRAGHSLGSGFKLVYDEMSDPIATEFGRCFEEQNLGISVEESLGSMTDRMPSLDLQFFATSVILQRQTGGDLAEILDKIGHIVRERFKIWGQVQALTGEGRLSGVVLLALPPVLFVAVWRLNPAYLKVLFTDPMGKKMLVGGLTMQLLGAIVIKKIVNIKV